MFKLSGNIRCASVESGRKLNLLWLKQKEHVLACDGNKILRVASVPGTAGLNSVSNIAEPGFSVYISQLLLVGSVVRQNLPKGHRRHFFHILPSSRLGQRVLLYFQSLIKSLVWRRCHAYLCISHFLRGKQWFDSGGWGPMFHTKNVVWVGAGALSKNRNSIKSTGDEFGAGGNTRCSYSSFEMMPLRQTSISYLCSVSHFQPLTPTPTLGLARVLTSLEEMPWSSLCFQILNGVPQICQMRLWQISSGPVLPTALPFFLTHYSNSDLL